MPYKLNKMVSYKQYVCNLIVANIVITFVGILFCANIIRNLGESNSTLIQSSIVTIGSVSILCAYCGITGVIRSYQKLNSCELNAYCILSRLVIISEITLYIFILFSEHEWNPEVQYQISNSVLTGVSIVLVLTQVWLLYETKAYQNLVNLSDGEDIDSELMQRRFSIPRDISDLEKPEGVFTLSDQLIMNPAFEPPLVDNFMSQTNESLNEMNNNFINDMPDSQSMPFMSQPVYQQLSQPFYNPIQQTYTYPQSSPLLPPPPYQVYKRDAMK